MKVYVVFEHDNDNREVIMAFTKGVFARDFIYKKQKHNKKHDIILKKYDYEFIELKK